LETRKRSFNSSWRGITTSDKQWWNLTYGELSRQSDLSLISQVSHINCYSMSESWGKAEAFENCGLLTFPWISCQLDGVLLDLVGLITQSQMTWPNHIYIYFPLIRYQDVLLCQESEKWKDGEIHRISSRGYRNLDGSREIRMSFCFVVIGLTLLFWVKGKSFGVQIFWGRRFRTWQLCHALL
jgi:hypothetical protein